MNLRILYRSVGSENAKNRPAFYSKQLALASLLRAVEQVEIPTTIVFVNDGPMPADRLSMMADAGEIIPVTCGSNRASYRHVLRMPRLRRWAADDLVWLAEDDYLYTENSLSALVSAAALPSIEYFTLYGTSRLSPTSTRRRPQITDDAVHEHAPLIEGVAWARTATTTSTFGLRVGTLVEDELLLRSIPFVGGAFDRATCLTLQGFQPFRLPELGGEPPKVQPATAAARMARRAALTGLRATLNAVALARPERRRRTLLVPVPSLATHMELGPALVTGHDWPAEADGVRAWMASRNASSTEPTTKQTAPAGARPAGAASGIPAGTAEPGVLVSGTSPRAVSASGAATSAAPAAGRSSAASTNQSSAPGAGATPPPAAPVLRRPFVA
ncbi:hypothetical protein [Candidatus Frankia alpina]|uniref:Uncharacterized protein n=1 Tax=Candidatus Frankia alpina TaxID=2699483 RepID=A0A4S5EQW3_9ACTN|nr:hypothetical protein [Candidatus Frankia alpina]THJ74805.1 hypothetical protein E7Y31_09235 [Candidatus Frankia alpina]